MVRLVVLLSLLLAHSCQANLRAKAWFLAGKAKLATKSLTKAAKKQVKDTVKDEIKELGSSIYNGRHGKPAIYVYWNGYGCSGALTNMAAFVRWAAIKPKYASLLCPAYDQAVTKHQQRSPPNTISRCDQGFPQNPIETENDQCMDKGAYSYQASCTAEGMLLTPCAGATGWEEEMLPDGQCYESPDEGVSRKFVCEGKGLSGHQAGQLQAIAFGGGVAAIVIAVIVYCKMKKKKKKKPPAPSADAGTPQGMPTAPQVQV